MTQSREFVLQSAANRIRAAARDLENCASEHEGDYRREIEGLAEQGAEIADELRRLSSG